MTRKKTNLEDIIGYILLLTYSFILFSENEFRIDKWYTVLFVALVVVGFFSMLTSLKKVKIINTGIELGYLHKKSVVIPFSDILEIIYKHHSGHTCYLEIKYDANKKKAKTIELSGREWTTLKAFIGEVDADVRIGINVKSKKTHDMLGTEAAEDLGDKYWEVESVKRVSLKNVIKDDIKDVKIKNVILGFLFVTVLAIFFSTKPISFLFIVSVAMAILSGLYLVVNIIAKMFVCTNSEVSRIFHRMCVSIGVLAYFLSTVDII